MPSQSVRAGALNRQGVIQGKSTTQGTYGEEAQTWSTVATVWMSVEPLTGRELQAAQALNIEISHEIMIRYQAQWADPKVMAKRRITYKGRIFNIQAAMNPEEANVYIRLLCSEGMNQG